MAVLRWVADGSPDGVMDGYYHRVSAAALRSRGLLRIAGRGPTWQARITEQGRALLARLDQPEGSSKTADPSSVVLGAAEPQANEPRADKGVERPDHAAPMLKTEELVADVIAAGGTLVRASQAGTKSVNWRQRAYAAQRHGKVPAGKRLAVSATPAGYEIKLEDGVTSNPLDAAPVPVPKQVRNHHPAVREFRDRTMLHEVSRRSLSRALRVLHALATEIDRRGFAIACVRAQMEAYGRSDWKPTNDGQFVATVDGHDFKLRISEKGVGLRGPWEAHKQRRQEDHDAFRFDRWDVGRIEAYDKQATGELNIALLGCGHRQRTWGDRKRWSLEDRLPQVLRELETLADEAEQRRLERLREEEERQRAWEAAMATAKERALEAYRVKLLRQRTASWSEAEDIRAYCNAVEGRHREALLTEPEAARWVDFAREYADRLQRLPRMPADPELGPEDLKPYLGGWSPYGPEPRRW